MSTCKICRHWDENICKAEDARPVWMCYTCGHAGDATDDDSCPSCGTASGDGFGLAENDPDVPEWSGLPSGTSTHPDFGCVHHKPRRNAKLERQLEEVVDYEAAWRSEKRKKMEARAERDRLREALRVLIPLIPEDVKARISAAIDKVCDLIAQPEKEDTE